ncbi:MAG TPA: outer membrane beta-barrel protein [bacterium]|nr:outer membrane beta-barrel protein [bacterium]
MKKAIGLYVALVAALIPALAQAVTFHPLIGFGAEFGGDKLLSVTYSDGSKSDVYAGQGFSAFGGVAAQGLIDLSPITLDLQATLGVKYSTISDASNASLDYFRFPLELLAFVHWRDLRVGAGPVYHFGNSFTGSGTLSPYTFTFDNAFGVTAQADYTFGQHWNIGVRFTSITYQSPSNGIGKTNGDNVGGELSYFL